VRADEKLTAFSRIESAIRSAVWCNHHRRTPFSAALTKTKTFELSKSKRLGSFGFRTRRFNHESFLSGDVPNQVSKLSPRAIAVAMSSVNAMLGFMYLTRYIWNFSGMFSGIIRCNPPRQNRERAGNQSRLSWHTSKWDIFLQLSFRRSRE